MSRAGMGLSVLGDYYINGELEGSDAGFIETVRLRRSTHMHMCKR